MIGDKLRRNILVSTDHGSMIVNRFDYHNNGSELIGHGQWLLDHGNSDTIDAFVCIKILELFQDPVMFDIGANIGTITTLVSNILRSSEIFCFEPQIEIFKILCGNLAINNHYNCHPYNLALGNEVKIVEIPEPNYFVPNDFGIFSLIENKISSNTGKNKIIDVVTLDSFVSKHKIEKINLIKIDTEGMDLLVLQGAKESIKKFNPVIYVEHSDNKKSILEEIKNYLNEDNYNFKVIGNNLLVVPKLMSIPNLSEIGL